MTIKVLIFLVFFAAPAGTIVHELGHAAAAKWLGASCITLSIGTGDVIYRLERKHMIISIHTMFFIGGLAGSERETPYEAHEQTIIAASGPVISMLAAALCLTIYTFYPSRYLLLLLLFNAWIALINLIPFRWGERQSDGYTIYQAIKQK